MSNFRISPISMFTLFVVCVLCTLGIRYGTNDLARSMFHSWNYQNVFWILVVARSIVIVLFAIVPFRAHLDEFPGLSLVTVTISFAGTTLPWLLLGTLNAWIFMVVLVAHIVALAIWWLLFFDEQPQKKEV